MATLAHDKSSPFSGPKEDPLTATEVTLLLRGAQSELERLQREHRAAGFDAIIGVGSVEACRAAEATLAAIVGAMPAVEQSIETLTAALAEAEARERAAQDIHPS